MPLQTTYGLTALLQCSMELRNMAEGALSLEEAGDRIVSFLRGHFIDKVTGQSALPLVRMYVTQRIGQLEPSLRDYAMAAGVDARSGPDVQCLTLLATAGEEDAWNDRRRSVGHKAIPLPSVEAINRMPMVAQLIEQLGLDPRHVIDPDPSLFHDLDERSYNVFYVADAREHPSIPAQADFVIPYGIRSMVGFGGVLPDGMLLAVVMFSRIPIPPSAVSAFAAAALSVKIAALPLLGAPVFAGHPRATTSPEEARALEIVCIESRANTLDQLLEVRAGTVNAEASRLENLLARAEDRAAELHASRQALALSEARKTAIVEGALDCVIGMDASGSITDFNEAAERTFGWSRAEVLGEQLGEVLVPATMRERHRLGITHLRETGEGPIIGRRIEVHALHADGHEFPVELTVTQLADVDPPQFTGYLRDLTSQRRAAADLAASHERLAHIARTLQTSLLPPSLPEVEGFELAAAFHAMGDGFEVGGDFYDVFELKDGRWAFTLGDVCGKGSEAAAITALARYTTRAAAMRSRNVATVMQTVNEAIHRNDPSRFCTAAYVTIGSGSTELSLALGGHPQPLLLRRDGTVEEVGEHGPLLGPFPEWTGRASSIAFHPGDLLLLFSDGITEARAGDEFFGEDRLIELLRGAQDDDAVDLVRRIESAVLGFAGVLSDDVTMLAIRAVG